MDEIRQYVRLVLEEDKELMKKWALGSDDPHEQELAKLGIVPIGRGEYGTSELGSGMYNMVREVLYNGKRAAARYSDSPHELDRMLKFVSYKDKMPAKYRKHFPKIYDTFEFDVRRRRYKGVVMELLQPMPTNLEADITHASMYSKISRVRAMLLINNPSIMKQEVDKITSNPEIKKKLLAFYNDAIKPLTLQALKDGSSYDTLDIVIDKAIQDQGLRDDMTFTYYAMYKRFNDSLKGEVVPSEEQRQYNLGTSPIVTKKFKSKAVQDLVKFIQALKENGVTVKDLHTGNFMMRPGTGDFVIVDPGLFKYSEY